MKYDGFHFPFSTLVRIECVAFSDDLRRMITEAMDQWQNKTCIKFVEKSRHHVDFIVFSQQGCGYAIHHNKLTSYHFKQILLCFVLL